jgi:hypothetical protein
VSKHVAVISELSRLMDVQKLLELSETEQEVACQGDQQTTFEVCAQPRLPSRCSSRVQHTGTMSLTGLIWLL